MVIVAGYWTTREGLKLGKPNWVGFWVGLGLDGEMWKENERIHASK